MAIDLRKPCADIKAHLGHDLVCVTYGEGENVAIECNTCGCVLIDADMPAKKYNHAFDIAFSLENESPDGEATPEELLDAIEKRLQYLRRHPEEVVESCGAPHDTYEVEGVN